MGAAGDHLALGAYLGPAGLNTLYQLADSALKVDDFDKMFGQKCLMGSFEDRQMLDADDLSVIKELELKYRGHNQWPVFRSYEPGYYPWFLEAHQCRFLTYIFQQGLDVCLRKRRNQVDFGDPWHNHFLIRRPHIDKNSINWTDEYQKIDPEPTNYCSFKIVDELMLKRLRSLKIQPGLVLEADVFYFPTPIKEKGRPYFPLVSLLIEEEQGIILGNEMFQDIKTEGYKCLDMLINQIQNIQKLPAKLLVSQDRSFFLYQDVCEQLGIKLEQSDDLPVMEEVRKSMAEFLDQ